MRLLRFAFFLGAAVAFAVPSISASATGSDPCQVLTADTFGQVMGYTATVDKTASTQMTCFYQGPNHSGGDS